MTTDAGTITVTLTVGGATVRGTLCGIDRGADPVVLLPGLGGSTDTEFAFLLPLLARTGRVLAVDLQYWAGGPVPLESVVDQLSTVLGQVLPGRRVTLVGFSVGATVAATYASSSADVASLVLVTPVLRASHRHRLMAQLRSRLVTSDPGSVADLDRLAAHSPSYLQARTPEPTAPEPTAPDDDDDDDISARHRLFAASDLTGSVAGIPVPTLVVGCDQDDLAGVDQARQFFASLPNARYAEIDSGHAVLAERPAEVLALIREFAAHPSRIRPGSVREGARP